MIFEDDIKELLKEYSENVILEIPPDPKLGDYAFPCFGLAKQLKKSPAEIARDISSKFRQTENIEKAEAAGPYVNFFVNKAKRAEIVLKDVMKKKDRYGSSRDGKGKTIVIDFSAPNIAKPFGIGHLRSTVIGNSLNKIYSFLGYKCIGVNHLGDWGTQFGKLIAAYTKWGDEKELEKEPIKYLYGLYVRFHTEAEKDEQLNDEARQWFKKLEDGDKEATKLWELFRELSLEEFKQHYAKLDIKFDSYNGESFYNKMLDKTIETVKSKIKTEISDDALIVNLDEYAMPPLLLRKSDEASTYATRDLAAALYRIKEYRPEKILYVVGVTQQLHFRQAFKVLELMGYKKEMFEHVNFGTMSFKEGKMSTRKGNIIFLEEVLDRAVELAGKIIEEKNPNLENKKRVAEQVAIGAMIFADLRNDRIKDIVFDWDKVLSFEGETGPYVQYTHARCCSVLRKARIIPNKADMKFLIHTEEDEVVKLLERFPEVINDAAKSNKPHILASYLIDLCQNFNNFYQKHTIVSMENEYSDARLILTDCVRTVLRSGIGLLGIKAVEEM
jgi:arginyl-tRNA synthetase